MRRWSLGPRRPSRRAWRPRCWRRAGSAPSSRVPPTTTSTSLRQWRTGTDRRGLSGSVTRHGGMSVAESATDGRPSDARPSHRHCMVQRLSPQAERRGCAHKRARTETRAHTWAQMESLEAAMGSAPLPTSTPPPMRWPSRRQSMLRGG